MGGSEVDPGKDSNRLTNKTNLVQVCCEDLFPIINVTENSINARHLNLYFVGLMQKKVLDHLLMLGVESQWAPVAVRCSVR